ncbi:MAG: hypothetical protein QN681_11150, partial [Nitrososphaeraceae archaeon]|nr:hypothetical protein [Nitrososphaeraceae archaeon]
SSPTADGWRRSCGRPGPASANPSRRPSGLRKTNMSGNFLDLRNELTSTSINGTISCKKVETFFARKEVDNKDE